MSAHSHRRIRLTISCTFLLVSVLFLSACHRSPAPVETSAAETTATVPVQTESESLHSSLYLEGVDAEDVIRYFQEVCLDAEIVNSGDPSPLQKWVSPICYSIQGSPAEEDLSVINQFASWLNGMEGFPGIYETEDPMQANLQFHFCSPQEMLTLMGDHFVDMDGAVTFWYEEDVIYRAIICCRTDLSQPLRNSVILEELYNGLGPIQDTALRPDSIIYAEYAETQSLSQMDKLILELLYHPAMECGMTALECEAVIRKLYY